MKKILFALMAVSLIGACSNPALKWIDTPGEMINSTGDDGRIAGQRSDKEIIAFSFGLGSDVENDLPIGKSPDHTGKFPIKVILTGPSSLVLAPAITYTGKSVSPGSGTAVDFSSSESSPVMYTVVAEDGSSREYAVTVYKKTKLSKEIVRFDLELGSGLAVEGSIDQTAGTITATVPAGTDLTSLSAHGVHTGLTVLGPTATYNQENFYPSGDFSNPTIWTVIDNEGGSKQYTLRVNREPSGAREITSFRLGIAGEEAVIGGEPQPDGKYPILVLVPFSPGLILNRSPFIDYTGVSISPAETSSENFGDPLHPVTYTVTAENGSTRDYAVTLITKDVPDPTDPTDPAWAAKEIRGFYFRNPLAQGVIDQTAGTIVITVPEGTNLRNLQPDVYFDGASVSPKSGQPKDFTGSDTTPVIYTVRAHDGTNKPYGVSVYTTPVPPTVDTGTETAEVGVGTDTSGKYTIIVEFPIHIDNPVININYPASSKTINISDDDVYNITTGDHNETVVIVNPPANPPVPSQIPSSAASIDAFYFIDPAAVGVIGSEPGTDVSPISITVTVPYGTDRQNLQANIVFTGKAVDGVPGHSPLKDNVRSFQTPVDYVVIAENDTDRKYYRVTVTPGAPNSAAEITAFSFVNVPPTKALISGISIGGNYPIEITVPQGTGLTSLTPVITYNGASIVAVTNSGNSFSPPGGKTVTENSAVDFTPPVLYKVTAEDSITTKTYAVTVREEVDENIEITGFYFTNPLAVGKINQNANTISVTVPSGTGRGSLSPSVYFTGMALNPGSGTANNFTSPVEYTLTGVTGKTRIYTVMVNPAPSGSKDITRFKLSGVVNSGLIIGAAPDPDGTYPISVRVPGGTNLSSLGTEITHTGVSVSPAAETPRNFNSPQTYTVTAEDGSAKTYKVTVHAEDDNAKLITSFIFDAVPLSVGGPVRVVASIDQTNRTISAAVPSTAIVTGLIPTITYIGKSITPPVGEGNNANPFTDSAGRDFTGPVTYTVKAQDESTVPYTVSVTKQSGFTVTFEGDGEIAFVSNTFNPVTGIVEVTVDDTAVDPPYDWYLDGVKQGVSGSVFTVNVGNGSFYPGRYEIMVSGKKNGLHYTGKVYFVVSGGA
jgi:hypothetical protein